MGGGTTSSDSNSRPLTGPERANVYSSALGELYSSAPGLLNKSETAAQGPRYITDEYGGQYENPDYKPGRSTYALNAPSYEAPSYVASAAPKTLSGGDYEALQRAELQGNTAGLDYAKSKDLQNFNNSAGAKGIWSSGLALKGEGDIKAGYAPQYEKAGADATAQRYGLQSGENQAVNAFNQQESGARNTFNANNAQQNYNSKWAPLNYLQGMWNGTGGAISNGSSGGFNFNL